MREVELSRQAQRRQNKQDKRKRAPDEHGEPSSAQRDQPGVPQERAGSSLRFESPNLDLALQPGMRSSPSESQPFGPSQPYTLGLDTSGSDPPPTNGFQDFERWSSQDGFNYSPGLSGDMVLSQFVDAGNFDSPRADLWKDFPEQFNDPSLLTSSLYGLPVLSGPMTMTATGMQGQPPTYLGTDFTLYSESSHAYLVCLQSHHHGHH
jgi:hypothetical protein